MRYFRFYGAAACLAAGLLATSAGASTVFSDNFNRTDLNPDPSNPLWVGGSFNGNVTSGAIIADPLGSAARGGVLRFDSAVIGGDAFTSVAFAVIPGQTYTLSFDYLGTPVATETGGNGGFIGLSDGTPANHVWIAGTYPAYLGASSTPPVVVASPQTLTDDNAWHKYTITFVPNVTNLHVMIEDFSYAGGGRPQDAFFDNINVAAVPTPAAAASGLALLGGLAVKRRRA